MGNRDKVFILTKAGNVEIGRMLDAPASEVEKAVSANSRQASRDCRPIMSMSTPAPTWPSVPKRSRYLPYRRPWTSSRKKGRFASRGSPRDSDYANICMAALDGGYYDVIQFPVNFATVLPHIRDAVLAAKKAEKSAGGSRREQRRGRLRETDHGRAGSSESRTAEKHWSGSHEGRSGGISSAIHA